MKFKIFLCLSVVMLIGSFATAQIPCGLTVIPAATLSVNWPQFHFDPNHSGCNPYESMIGSNIVGNLTLAWEYETIGQIEGSPVVANGMVYIGSQDYNLYALNATTGALVWKYYTGYRADYSPAVANGIVYTHYEDQNSGVVYTVALDAGTGTEVWKTQITEFGSLSTPTVVNGVLYENTDRQIAALDAKTGYILWVSDDIDASANSVASVANGVVYAITYDGYLYAFDAATGKVLWNVYVNERGEAVAVVNGVLYASNDGLLAINAKTGALIWSFFVGPTQCNLSVACGPAVADGVVYAQDLTATYAFNAITGAPLWMTRIAGTGSSPAVANGVVYIGAGYDNNIYALDAHTGAVLWKYTTGAAVNSSPVIANGMVYTGSEDGNVYAFHLPGH